MSTRASELCLGGGGHCNVVKQYPISLDMLHQPLHLRYREREGGLAVCVAGIAYPYKPSLREVGGSIFGFHQAACWCKRAENGMPLAI